MGDSKRDTDVYSGLLDSEEEEEGGMIWEYGRETCILSCKKRITSLCSMQETQGWCTEMIWRDDVGWEVEAGVHVWELMYTRGEFMSMYAKTNTVL